jgi:hypothetical protein
MGGMMGDMMDSAIKAAAYALPLAIVEILANALCLFGVIMMWKLKKTGYFMYVFAQLASIVTPIVLIGFGGVFGGIMIIAAIFPIAFIVMYGLNLKHMK